MPAIIVTGDGEDRREHDVDAIYGRLESLEQHLTSVVETKADRDHGHEELAAMIGEKADRDHTHPELATPADIVGAIDELVTELEADVSDLPELPPAPTEIEPAPAPTESEPTNKHAGMLF